MKDAVDRLTPLGVMVLALVREGDMHPYEMMRLLRQRHDDRLVPVTNGTLYHTVRRLEKAGLLSEVGVDRDGNRPERTTYALTDAGHGAVSEWVRRELPRIDRAPEFRVALAEAHNLDRAETIELLRRRREALVEAHALHRDGREKALRHGVLEQFLLEVGREEQLLAADLTWIDAVLARLDQPDFVWGVENLPLTDRYLEQRKAARL